MTDLPDWAKDRARDWLETVELDDERDVDSLAALLVEVHHAAHAEHAAYNDRQHRRVKDECWEKAEVRRVVEEYRRSFASQVPLNVTRTREQETCDEILARLEKLK